MIDGTFLNTAALSISFLKREEGGIVEVPGGGSCAKGTIVGSFLSLHLLSRGGRKFKSK
jgi:hypothetical protein